MQKITPALLLLSVLYATCALPKEQSPDAVRKEAREIFQKVIAFRTSEGLGQVPAMAQYLAERFRAAGFPEQDIHILPVGETASLVVRYRGSGRGARPILLLAHMDVVTAKPEEWQRDPFTLVEENGYFFGRGTLDNKQGVTVLTSTFLRLRREGFVPKRDLIVAFSGDEETGMLTASDLATTHRELVDAEFALNSDDGGGQLDETTGKPQYLSFVGAEKISSTYQLTVHNPGGHSSAPRADNAIYQLADALKAVQAYQFPVKYNDWTIGSFKATGPVTAGPLGAAMTRFAANPKDEAAAAALAAVPTEVGKTRTTCVATMLNGGHASNALPQTATATVNCRIFPGTSVDEVKATLQEVVGKNVEVRNTGHTQPADASPLRRDVLASVTKAAQAIYPGIPVVPGMVPWATDGSIFRGAGIPTYGASGSMIKASDSFSHGLNERLPVESFYDELTYWYVLLKDLAGKR
ncbi:MAG TPA: M20/M25/M40 family metallo-hydrolase [Steroidobacteraceae bacterium]|nr:M20/M25/M40 family metallo-hydrolase [Steroidobacteraceae bacterium]